MSSKNLRPSPMNAFGHKPNICEKRDEELEKKKSSGKKSMDGGYGRSTLMYLAVGGLTIAGGYFLIKKLTRKKHVRHKKK